MMRRLCLGGSFNPIHRAHLACGHAVATSCGFDRVVLIPSAQPPHKSAANLASPADRLTMCQLAAQTDPLFEVNDLELHRTGPSYTIDTVRALKARGWAEVSWLIGADMLLMLPEWHQASDLLAQTHFVIVARPGWSIDWSGVPELLRPLEKNVVHAPLLDISATDIRRRVRENEPITHLTFPTVADYILEKGLYR